MHDESGDRYLWIRAGRVHVAEEEGQAVGEGKDGRPGIRGDLNAFEGRFPQSWDRVSPLPTTLNSEAVMTKRGRIAPKFEIGDRVRCNGTATKEHRGKPGTVFRRGPGRSQYLINLEGAEGSSVLYSWMLDSDTRPPTARQSGPEGRSRRSSRFNVGARVIVNDRGPDPCHGLRGVVVEAVVGGARYKVQADGRSGPGGSTPRREKLLPPTPLSSTVAGLADRPVSLLAGWQRLSSPHSRRSRGLPGCLS